MKKIRVLHLTEFKTTLVIKENRHENRVPYVIIIESLTLSDLKAKYYCMDHINLSLPVRRFATVV